MTQRAARWPDVVAAGIRALPAAAGERAAGALASLAGPWLSGRRQVALAQLELAFPELDLAARESIWRDSVLHQSKNLIELAELAGSPKRRAAMVDRVEIRGLEHLDRARSLAADGCGVVVVTAHLGNWELCLAAMAAAGYPMTVVHHGLGRPGLSSWLADVRTRQGDVQLVELGSVRPFDLLAAVRGGRHLVAMMDQNARRAEGVFAPFFGAAACTRRGPVVLAQRLGVPLLPAFSHRIDAGSTHRVDFGEGIEIGVRDGGGSPAGSGAVVARALERVNRVIEDAIRAHPDQWIWSHRRFKTRPGEEEAPGMARGPRYPSRRAGRFSKAD